MACNTIELVNEDNSIELSNNEKYFLRLFVLNYDDQYILNFLKMEKKGLGHIKRTLKMKFKTKDWVVLIQKAFELGILKERDYVDPTIKKITLAYAAKIINDFKSKPSRYNLPNNILFDFDKTIRESQKKLKITLK
ncbi:hypothetical protein Q4Q35_06975 [Flavivirga aquimarina]|uniref:Uncharacterized protein n=1 Tax=Flavivirga aquimarina TaxID=2027862 RepID=A0ABT8W8T7_9FLAO|nr:hypothetical protein [Flavivirga aquimarina]MDO5969544.1 hypothetical protein [Flavivirga aquimarina]